MCYVRYAHYAYKWLSDYSGKYTLQKTSKSTLTPDSSPCTIKLFAAFCWLFLKTSI